MIPLERNDRKTNDEEFTGFFLSTEVRAIVKGHCWACKRGLKCKMHLNIEKYDNESDCNSTRSQNSRV